MMSRAMIGNLPVLSDREFEAAWLRRDYVRYCQTVHHGQWQPGRHHALIAKKLMGIIDGSIKRLMIWMPPRHGKSMEITETFPSFFLGHFPDKHVIEVSYGDELARKFGASNRAKVQEFGGWIFGIGVSQTQGAKTNWDIANHAGGMISVGVGGSMTGKGADLLIVDDPIKNRQEADSVTYRKGLISEWQSTIYTRLHVGGAVIVILTRWHESDFAASLLNPENGEPEEWDVLSLPCICDDPNDLLGRKPGEALWPEMGYDEEWARRTRLSVGEYTWFSLYQQKPRPDSGAIFKREWLTKRYSVMPPEATVIQSWDLPFLANEESAKCAGFVVGRYGANIYVEYCVNDKMEFTETIAAIRDMTAKHPEARGKVVEKAANGSAVINYLKGEIPGLIPFVPSVSKEERARATTPYYEAGNVYFKEGGKWVQEVVEDLVSFPNGKFKDTVDALTQAILYLETVLGAFGGIIYRGYAENPAKCSVTQDEAIAMLHDKNSGQLNCEQITIGISPGSVTRGASFVATAITNSHENVVVIAAYCCSVSDPPDLIADHFRDFTQKVEMLCGTSPEYAYCAEDNQIIYRAIREVIDAASLSISIRKAASIPENDRIDLTRQLISMGRLFICDQCANLSAALLEAKWDEKKTKNARVDDGVADTGIIKAFEYTIERQAKWLISE